MASIFVASGVVIHEVYKNHKQKKAAKKADQEELQAENQRRFDRMTAQHNPFSDANEYHAVTEAPPAYNAVVTGDSKQSIVDAEKRASMDSEREGQRTHGEVQASTAQGGGNEGVHGSGIQVGGLVHPAYRSS